MVRKKTVFRFSLQLLAAMIALPAALPAHQAQEPAPALLSDKAYPERSIERIAFGSCNKPWLSQGFWNTIAAAKPELMLLLGDNHYAESTDPEKLKRAYNHLAAIPQYKEFRRKIPTLATWDNHDYGAKYPGRLHPHAEQSEQLFLEHFAIPKSDIRQQRKGIYGAWVLGSKPRRVQIIMLDLQRFRDPFADKRRKRTFLPEPGKTLMGTEQWQWFEKQLKVEADIRIIGSAIQVLSNEHSWRRWGMFPDDRKKLLQLIGDSKGTTLLLSGDRHRGEISVLKPASGRPLYDITASSFNHCYPNEEKNSLRTGELIAVPHFGLLEIDWEKETLTMQLLSAEDGKPLLSRTLGIKEKPTARQEGQSPACKP